MNYSKKNLLTREQFYLLLEGRSVKTDLQGFKDLIYSNCKIWLNNKDLTKIYRGVKNSSGDYMHINPKDYNRESIGMKDKAFYQTVIDTSEKWQDYPKRSKSIICSTFEDKASDWGDVYEVIPYDNANVGVCPTGDIWYAFKDFTNGDIQEGGNDVFYKIPLLINKKLIPVVDQESLLKYCNFVDEHIDQLYDELIIYNTEEEKKDSILQRFQFLNVSRYLKQGIYGSVIEKFHQFGTYNALQQIYDPIYNNFNLLTYDSKFKVPEKREIWTDSECLLIAYDLSKLIRDNL